MKRQQLINGFCLTGGIMGAAKPDVVWEASLPVMLKDACADCGMEGVFLRQWDLLACIEKPEESPHSRAERTLLTLDGISGNGEVFIGEASFGLLRERMVLDITEQMRSGSCILRMHFLSQQAVLYPGERGRDLRPHGGLLAAEVRNIYFLQIADVSIDKFGNVSMEIYAYGAGKVRFCLRLMYKEELLWSENITQQVMVGRQSIRRMVPRENLRNGGILRVTVDMGGEGCDEAETVCSLADGTETNIVHFLALPSKSMLETIKSCGFDTVMLHCAADRRLHWTCANLGLNCRRAEEPPVITTLYQQNAKYHTPQGQCLCVPVSSEQSAALYRQAVCLSEAVLTLRMEEKSIDLLAWGRQCDAQDGLFDKGGKERPAAFAIKNALRKVCVRAEGTKKMYRSCEEFSAAIVLLRDEAVETAVTVQVQLYAWNGDEIAHRVYAVAAGKRVQRLGEFKTMLPWHEAKGLMLRMQCIRNGKILSVDHAYYPCADEDGNRIPFPEADITECTCGGEMELFNASDAIAMGVTVRSGGKTWLCFGAMLPNERIALAQKQDIMLQYLNAVTKGGASRVAQRILRGVFGDQNAALADP